MSHERMQTRNGLFTSQHHVTMIHKAAWPDARCVQSTPINREPINQTPMCKTAHLHLANSIPVASKDFNYLWKFSFASFQSALATSSAAFHPLLSFTSALPLPIRTRLRFKSDSFTRLRLEPTFTITDSIDDSSTRRQNPITAKRFPSIRPSTIIN